jgi:hypothetical protein
VIETTSFRKGSEEIGMSDEERESITLFISQNPKSGDIIPGTGGARKLRFPFGGKGKSGGCRVITYFAAEDVPVFLLDVFSKSVRINLSQSERNELKKELSGLAQDYRNTMSQRMKEIGRAS